MTRELTAESAPTEEEAMAQRQQRILRERALALAQEGLPAPTADGCLEIVEFLLAGERYGIESSYVSEVHLLRDLTPLPCTPSFVLGVVGIRGRILPVLDLRSFFDLPTEALGDLNRVITLRDGLMEFGLLADAILQLRPIPLATLHASLPTLTGIRAEYLKGISQEGVVVLDGGKLLADRSMVIHEEV